MCDNPACKARIEQLEKIVEQLQKKLAKYDNAHTPSSQKPYFDKPKPNETTEKPSGRPDGHDGIGRETPDEIHERKKLEAIRVCPDCGKPIRVKRWRKRVVTRLVPGRLENAEYDIPQGYCNGCHKSIEPVVPNALPNSRFDLTLALWIACLRMLGVSVDKIRFLLQTDYGLKISSATVVNTCNKLAEFLGEDYELLRKDLMKEKHVHGDETSWRTKGKLRWLWEFISKNTAYFTIRDNRSHEVPVEVMKGFKGVFSSDFYNAYNFLECEKQRCWVHLKRELDKVLKYSPSSEFTGFASRLMRLYYWAKSERNHGTQTRAFAEYRLQALLSKDYTDLNCKRLVKTLSRNKNELFTFCSHRGVETNNNHAERGIRPAVVIRKTSFGSQSDQGAQTTSVLMSFFQTARLREENFIDYMQEMTQNRLQN